MTAWNQQEYQHSTFYSVVHLEAQELAGGWLERSNLIPKMARDLSRIVHQGSRDSWQFRWIALALSKSARLHYESIAKG